MFMQWGQFIDHDIGLTLVGLSVNQFAGEALDCSKTCDHIEPCFSIPLEKNDPRAQRRHLGGRSNNTNGCIELIRSAAFCGTGLTSAATGQVVKREQVNRITSFIDASMVYGSDEVMARELRMKGRDTGLLATHVQDGRHYMPLDDLRRPFLDCQQSPGDSETPCFLAGDTRANEQLGLTAMHTLFVREHNRIAKQLTLMNRRWSGEKVYQTARLIVGAMMQKITYSDWLPMVIGPQLMAKLVGQYGGYDDRVDPSATNVFQTAAFRFGHTLIRPFLTRLNSSNLPLERYKAELPLVEAFFAPFRLLAEGGVDPIIRGLVATGMKQVRPDMVINAQLTEHLFELSRDVSLDLAAINIQRGRDHGLPGYNDWRHFCGLPVAQTFDDLRNEIRDKKVRSKLSALYGHPGNIDLWVAGVAENTVPGGQVGPTFACLIAEQFKRTRTGDRFWYENLFTVDQIKEIQKSSLAAILCSSSDGIVNVPRNVFKLAHPDKWSSCASVDQLDLSKWSATSETDNCIET
ncbi:Peroxidasin [Halotydeus destructor]|nr:Peroxidasin [Halotydeus destructor]